MLRHIGNYDFGGHTAIRVIEVDDSGGVEITAAFQFNFTVRKRVAREDGDEHLFDFHTVVVRPDATIDDRLAKLSAKSYSADLTLDQHALAALTGLDAIGVNNAYELAKAHLEAQTKLWDWEEEVDLIGVAKVVFVRPN